VRHRLQIGLKGTEQFVLQLRVKIIWKAAAEFGLDFDVRLSCRATEETIEHLLRRDRIAVTRQDLGMRATGNDFAVDQHAIAIEDDEFRIQGRSGFIFVQRDAI
jgi:hypothetical protein